jgi:hypothetical protein
MPGGLSSSMVPHNDPEPGDIDTSVALAAAGERRFSRTVIGLRGRAEMARFFEDLELLEPGVVPVNHWRPGPGGPDPERTLPCYGAVGQQR